MDSPRPCTTCKGQGPVPRWALNAWGERVPLPFEACVECGLDWPTARPLAPLPLPSHGRRRPSAPPEKSALALALEAFSSFPVAVEILV